MLMRVEFQEQCYNIMVDHLPFLKYADIFLRKLKTVKSFSIMLTPHTSGYGKFLNIYTGE